MYCAYCGSEVKNNARFCGKCGNAVVTYVAPPAPPKVIYVEEKPLTPILEDRAVVALTFCILIVSIVTIIIASAITKDVVVYDMADGFSRLFMI